MFQIIMLFVATAAFAMNEVDYNRMKDRIDYKYSDHAKNERQVRRDSTTVTMPEISDELKQYLKEKECQEKKTQTGYNQEKLGQN